MCLCLGSNNSLIRVSAAMKKASPASQNKFVARVGTMTNPIMYRINDYASLYLCDGDITRARTDAIVNAANERMLGGGGVDGAIHRAAGDQLLEACRNVPLASKGIRCPTGEARITPGFRLPAKYVIHTVGPIYTSRKESAPLLEASHRSSLALANEHKLKSIAFPAISTGVYGYPREEAAVVALKTVQEAVGDLAEVHFVLFGRDTLEVFVEVAQRVFGPPVVAKESSAAEAVKGEGSVPKQLSKLTDLPLDSTRADL